MWSFKKQFEIFSQNIYWIDFLFEKLFFSFIFFQLLHYLGRLSRLRITVQDLADTGIGRTVNSLSRNEGQIGAAADTLVRRWKQMVSEQQTQAEQRRQSEEESDSNSGSSEEEEDEDEENPPDDSQPYQIEDQQEHQPYSSSADAPSAASSSSLPKRGGYPQDDEDDDEDLNDDIDDPYMENGFMTMANVHSDPENDEEEEDFDKGKIREYTNSNIYIIHGLHFPGAR